MKKSHILVITLLFSAVTAYADPVDFITLDTGALNGTTGSIDFQFNPGIAALGATVQISGFTGVTYISSSQMDFGTASGGAVPATITLSNTSADNEDFEDVTFGPSLAFEMHFSGPAISSPNGDPANESTFAFSVFTDLPGTIPATSIGADPATGNVADITVSPEGALVPDVISPNAGIAPVPEPGTIWLLGAGLLAVCHRRLKKTGRS